MVGMTGMVDMAEPKTLATFMGQIPEVIIAQSARLAGAGDARWDRVSQWMRVAKDAVFAEPKCGPLPAFRFHEGNTALSEVA